MKTIVIIVNDELKDDQRIWEVDVKTKKKNILFVNDKIYKLIENGHIPEDIFEELSKFDFGKGDIV